MFLKQNLKTVLFILLLFHGIYPEPHCSKYHYEERLLEKMVRLEFSVENMRKEIESTKEQTMKTLDELETERKSWENTLMTKKLAEKNPGVVFSARNPKDKSLTNGLIMVYTEIIVNKGDGYNKENGIFTVPHTGIYMFEVQFCMHGDKKFHFALVANDEPFKISYVRRKTDFSCYNIDAVTFVNKNDNVKMKIISPSSGVILAESDSYHWNTFSGALIQAL